MYVLLIVSVPPLTHARVWTLYLRLGAFQAISPLRKVLTYFKKSTLADTELTILRAEEGIARGLESIGKTRFATVYWSALSVKQCLPELRRVVKTGRLSIKVCQIDCRFACIAYSCGGPLVNRHLIHRLSLRARSRLFALSRLSQCSHLFLLHLHGQSKLLRLRTQLQVMCSCSGSPLLLHSTTCSQSRRTSQVFPPLLRAKYVGSSTSVTRHSSMRRRVTSTSTPSTWTHVRHCVSKRLGVNVLTLRIRLALERCPSPA